jgi:DNA adenine methylase
MTKQIPEIKPILKYPGAKWSRSPWIVSHFPAHRRYLEPYCGSAAVFFSKDRVEHEVLGDINHHVINLFQVMRNHGEELARRIALTGWIEEEYHLYEQSYGESEDPIENARRFLIRCWQAHGTKLGSTCGWRHKGIHGSSSTTTLWRQVPNRLLAVIDRLKDAEIRCKPALELIDYYRHPDFLLYVDPPYLLSTRTYNLYANEMTDEEHLQLLDMLKRHPGPVVLSGYAHPLYEELLQDWQRVTMQALAEKGALRTEVLWLNKKAFGSQQGRLFEAMEEHEAST